MAEFLQGLAFFSVIGIILGIRFYRQEIILPRRQAKRTGKDVVVHTPTGGRVFRPDGTDFSFRSF